MQHAASVTSLTGDSPAAAQSTECTDCGSVTRGRYLFNRNGNSVCPSNSLAAARLCFNWHNGASCCNQAPQRVKMTRRRLVCTLSGIFILSASGLILSRADDSIPDESQLPVAHAECTAFGGGREKMVAQRFAFGLRFPLFERHHRPGDPGHDRRGPGQPDQELRPVEALGDDRFLPDSPTCRRRACSPRI